MSQIQLRRTFAVVFLVLTGAFLAQAQETNWGKWGADDQIGTWNYVTPEVMRHALSLVRKGEVYLLALPIEPDQVAADNRDGRIYRYMASTGQGAGHEPAFAEDELFTPVHGPTHWDGLAHIMGERKLYNGYDSDTYVTDKGALKNGLQNVANKMVTRGVLVDIARDQGVERLEPGYLITVADLEGAAHQENVSFQPGDVILIRTGWLSLFHELNLVDVYDVKTKEYKLFHRNEPGIGWAVSQWLKKEHTAAVAADNLYMEVLPCEPEAAQKIGHPNFEMPINYELIRNQGMMLGKVFQLDELAQACAADGVYEFFFVSPLMNLTNATGSPTNPLAIK